MANQTKDQLNKMLDACVDFTTKNGMKGLSLRSLAQGANMSARMLIHYFGNAENLFGRIMRRFVELEKVRADKMYETAKEADQPLQNFLEQYVAAAKDLSLANNIFEMYGAAILGNKGAADLLNELLSHWIEKIRQLNPKLSEVDAGILVSFANGAIFDFLATKDDKRIQDSIEKFCLKFS